MQRWIVIVALVLALLGGGAAFGLWKYKQSRPDRIFLPLPFNATSSFEEREKAAADLRTRLLTPEILAAVARDCGVIEKFGSEAAAVGELTKRAFVEAGEAPLPSGGRGPTLNIGFKGVRGEKPMLRSLAERLGKDLEKLIREEHSRTAPDATGF